MTIVYGHGPAGLMIKVYCWGTVVLPWSNGLDSNTAESEDIYRQLVTNDSMILATTVTVTRAPSQGPRLISTPFSLPKKSIVFTDDQEVVCSDQAPGTLPAFKSSFLLLSISFVGEKSTEDESPISSSSVRQSVIHSSQNFIFLQFSFSFSWRKANVLLADTKEWFAPTRGDQHRYVTTYLRNVSVR